MDTQTAVLPTEEEIIEYTREWSEEDLDTKGNYPDGLPPTDPENLWSFYDLAHFEDTKQPRKLGKFARSTGTRKVTQHSDGHTYILFVYGPQGSCVTHECTVNSTSEEDKQELVRIVEDAPSTAAKNLRKNNGKAARKLLRLEAADPPE